MDHCQTQTRKIHPIENANFFSKLSFFYTGKLFRKALKNELEETDLYQVTEQCNSKRQGDRVELAWNKVLKNGGKPTIGKLLWKCFGLRYLLLGLIHVCFRVFTGVVEPYVMSQLIGYFKEGQTKLTKQDAYYYGGVMMFLNIFHFFYFHNWCLYMQTLAIQIRTAFSSLIYRKSLKLTPSALVDVNFGNIVTLITKDVQTFQTSIWMFNDFWIYSIQALVVCSLLYYRMGFMAFMGIGIMLTFIPLQMYMGRIVTRMRLTVGAKTDERLQVTQETLSSIRIIKFYTWEQFFDDKVTAARKKEVNAMLKGFYMRIMLIMLGILGSKFSFYALISAYLWYGEDVSADLIFYIVACFKELRHSLGFMIPIGLARAAELYAAICRIDVILQAEELQKPEGSDEITIKPKIELKGVSVKIKDKTILKDLSISVNCGLILVTGNVGSGKSALLKTILQDYPKDVGHLVTYGRISYASQDPWLFPSSVRQNILFGDKYNAERYEEVVRVCALKYDLDLLDNRDETIVADRGINLSKGQQARINLARAVYRDSEIYLLDDSLTALDAHVQDYIFNECIRGFLKDKLVILVTQSAAHLEEADTVIIMKDGTIKSAGKPTKNLLKEAAELIGVEDDLEKEGKEDEGYEIVENGDEKEETKEEETGLIQAEQQVKRKKVYHEEKKKGSVAFKVYEKYVQFGGGWLMFVLILICFISAQYSESYSDGLLSKWVDYQPKIIVCNETVWNSTNKSSPEHNFTLSETVTEVTLHTTTLSDALNLTANNICSDYVEKSNFAFNMFTGMMAVSVTLMLLRSYVLLNFARVASFNIHKAMSHSIINAVMSFFDSHFIGNVINRFSQDLSNIDEHLPSIMQECARVLFSVLGVVALLTLVNWRFFIGFLIFFGVLILVRYTYMPTGRSLKRLEASTRSPLLGHLNASLEGLTTIRAFKQQSILIDEFDRHQDLYTSAHYTLTCSSRALGFCIDAMCSCYIFLIISRFLFFDTDETAGNVGLAITQVLALAGHVQWGVRCWAELENLMTSMERVIEYTQVKAENVAGQVIPNWPNKGAVKYNNVSLTYNNTHEKVLKNLDINVEAGEKIGIVGRTGAGKSSIISTLFRLYDIEGNITIDGVDTKTVQLYYLRQNIAIIPQDPILFSGTMRSNIDPLNKYSDAQIWEVIEKVKVKHLVPSLDMEITESGTNFSSGQRQLICLARAIIRKNRIVVLDEATANMDPETDVLLHNTIKENFQNCTVFTIAHRLHTIIDCDKVLVLDRGVVAEYDNPKNLLKNNKGLFYKMADQYGLLDGK